MGITVDTLGSIKEEELLLKKRNCSDSDKRRYLLSTGESAVMEKVEASLT